ncbi:MAG: hypothetical protein HY553_14360 [Elusimicrobia bacterium]|nr:hypothetical protein [Elusimicrobiota bacterium]
MAFLVRSPGEKPDSPGPRRLATAVALLLAAALFAVRCSRPRDAAESWLASPDAYDPAGRQEAPAAAGGPSPSSSAPERPESDLAGSARAGAGPGRSIAADADTATGTAGEDAPASGRAHARAGEPRSAGTRREASLGASPGLGGSSARSGAGVSPGRGASIGRPGSAGSAPSRGASPRAARGPARAPARTPVSGPAGNPAANTAAAGQAGTPGAAAGAAGAAGAAPEEAAVPSRAPEETLATDGGPAAEIGSCEAECAARCTGFGRECLTACAVRENCSGTVEAEDDGCRATPMRFAPVPDRKAVVQAVAELARPQFEKVCSAQGPERWVFVDRLVATLQEREPRFGYLCRRGNCNDLKDDVIAFYAGAGPPRDGSSEVRMIDVILNCGSRNEAQWLVFCWMPHYNGRWKRRR